MFVLSCGAEESHHFLLWAARLGQLGSHYGALPTHAGFWKMAQQTQGDILARLAMEHMTLEAHGCDVAPITIGRMRQSGDASSAELLEFILTEEVGHIAIGRKTSLHLPVSP